MPGFMGRELCPDLIIVPCNFKKYRVESAKVMKVIAEYDPDYSAMSLDEAYLDLTDHLEKRLEMTDTQRTYPKYYYQQQSLKSSSSSTEGVDSGENSEDQTTKETILFGKDADSCVQEIRHRIYLATNLTASAGIYH